MFKPINFHIEVEPIKQESFITSQDQPYEEKGKVVSLSEGVTKVGIGDTVFFDSWLVARYQDNEGKIRYIVPEETIRAIEK